MPEQIGVYFLEKRCLSCINLPLVSGIPLSSGYSGCVTAGRWVFRKPLLFSRGSLTRSRNKSVLRDSGETPRIRERLKSKKHLTVRKEAFWR
jgi:hypothetical protein